jgi:hypothetical protein
MAKKPELLRSGEMNFIVFSLRGGDETLQQSFRTISQALENAFNRRPLVTKGLPNTAGLVDREIESEVVDEPQEVITAENGEAVAKPESQRPSKKPSYKTVADLNLKPDKGQSLRDFFTEKRPESQQEQFVLILFYLTKILNLSGVGQDHIYTAFNDVGERVPNIGSMAKNIARRRGWINASDISDLKMTTPGENFVKHDLPRAGMVSDSTNEEE